jgi:hypothetical protein
MEKSVKLVVRICCLSMIAALMALHAVSQQTVAGPSLNQTMQFVNEKLMGIGKLQVVEQDTREIVQFRRKSILLTAVKFDTSTCALETTDVIIGEVIDNDPVRAVNHWTFERDTTTSTLNLQDVVANRVEEETTHNIVDGSSNPVLSVVKENFGQSAKHVHRLTLVVNLPQTRVAAHKMVERSKRLDAGGWLKVNPVIEQKIDDPNFMKQRSEANQDIASVEFYFIDEVLAQRVSTALSHAITLCRAAHPAALKPNPTARKPGEIF